MNFYYLQLEPPVCFTRGTMNKLRKILEDSFRRESYDQSEQKSQSHHNVSSSSLIAAHLPPSNGQPRRHSLSSLGLDDDPSTNLTIEEDQLLDEVSSSEEYGSLVKDVGKRNVSEKLNRSGKKKKGYITLLHDDEDEDESTNIVEEEDMADSDSHSSIRSPSKGNSLTSNSQVMTSTTSKLSKRPSMQEDDEDEMKGSELALDDAEPAYTNASVPSRKLQSMVRDIIVALALCHNVTPAFEEDGTNLPDDDDSISSLSSPSSTSGPHRVLQASSPDEVALVKFVESVGMTLLERTSTKIVLGTPIGTQEVYEVLHIFPFTSESKRMGIIVRSCQTDEITFYLKGAESIMKTKILPMDWLEEEVDNLARIGLRTLVIASKRLAPSEYNDFLHRYTHARSLLQDRDQHINSVMVNLERHMNLLGLTGVEDKLQDHVKSTLETLRNAGVKLWMLTGDKAETAICVGISARLIDRNQAIFQILNCTTQRDVARQLDLFSTKLQTCLVIDGPSLQLCLDSFEKLFLEVASASPAVICCRCSPTQKAKVVELMKVHTGKRTAAIGDGGNDVSMILAADVGVGIVGKEGKQASLAADFSITQFSHILPLLLWHGRNAYKRSARLSQFVIHRGLIISIIQAVFSSLFYFAAVPIYSGWLMVGYSTFYTMLPVFSLVLDEDVDENKVYLYPELYSELQKGRPLSFKTFFIWLFQSVYQGGVIMILSLVLFEARFINIVSITFTVLLCTELLNVALEVHRWHNFMIIAEVLSVVVYFVSLLLLPSYFG